PEAAAAFGGRVFKVGADDTGARLTYLKVTDGVLHVKDLIESRPDARTAFREKADQLREYAGGKYRLVSEAHPGDVVALTGLSAAYPGQGLGVQPDAALPLLEPVLNYRLRLPESADPHQALRALRVLEAEDPMLHVLWQEALG